MTKMTAGHLWGSLRFCPVWLAYRLIWLVALTGETDAQDVYVAMWRAGLDLPPIDRLVARAAHIAAQIRENDDAGTL